ncbi:MAG: D-tyrosyl-tRNA(Tyr) deacylase [Flavobacteriaceae bacterium]|nr:D-tyrosyl-tRNA(Tyr) deacylase [Flavobacteriaceae bacterium]|tara:strand:- start:23656 stop:24108 length:453 start_codon:yes stop_codon:yes gene_type:complete
MRVLIQRVIRAEIKVEKKVVGKILNGMLILVGIEETDNIEDIKWLVNKTINLRIFNDIDGVMNLSLKEVEGEILLVSQFTLMASTKKGNRPSYIRAANNENAILLYDKFKEELEILTGKHVESGIFGADMKVSLINDGPVTILIDSKNRE